MSKDFRMKLEKVFDFLGETIAFLAAVLYAVLILNYTFKFIPDNISGVLEYIKMWVGLLLIAVTGLECVIKRNIFIRIFFYLILAIIVVFMFFPDTYNTVVSLVPVKTA